MKKSSFQVHGMWPGSLGRLPRRGGDPAAAKAVAPLQDASGDEEGAGQLALFVVAGSRGALQRKRQQQRLGERATVAR